MTEPSRELIERFLRNECSEAEAEQVSRYLEQNPALLDKYGDRQEWDAAANNPPMPATIKDDMRSAVFNATRRKTPVRRLWMTRIATAACIVGVMIVGYQLIAPSKPQAITSSGNESLTSKQRTVTNSNNNEMKFTTEDGSTIELAAHSTVSYQEPFSKNARDFKLKGEAIFVVAKDQSRPFTVYAGGIATTALGTSFKIRAVDSEARVTVQLLTGKVAVSSEPAAIAKKQTMYLLPGQEMIFDKDKAAMALHLFKDRNSDVARAGGKPWDASGTTSETAEAWTFYNQPLPEILRTIQAYYTTNIMYSSKDLSKIRFTGTFNKSDSLSNILNTIGTISKLHVNRNGGAYQVGK